MRLNDNHTALERIKEKLINRGTDFSLRPVDKITVTGSASPEGNIRFNRQLSEKRTRKIFDYMNRYSLLPDSVKIALFIGRNWLGLLQLVESSNEVPYKHESLELLKEIVSDIALNGQDSEKNLHRLQQLRAGVPYTYMYYNLFPQLRISELRIRYKPSPVFPPYAIPPLTCTSIPVPSLGKLPLRSTDTHPASCQKTFYMGLRTNALYDILLVLNIGVESYLGRNWALAGNRMYAWWKSDRKYNYWRIYGGDIALRKWFGKQAAEKPLTGYHLGLYASLFTYDFEWGGKGYIGGQHRTHSDDNSRLQPKHGCCILAKNVSWKIRFNTRNHEYTSQ